MSTVFLMFPVVISEYKRYETYPDDYDEYDAYFTRAAIKKQQFLYRQGVTGGYGDTLESTIDTKHDIFVKIIFCKLI